MSVYELARQLGEELLKSEKAEALDEARTAFFADEKAQKLFNEFNRLKKELQDTMSAADTTKEKIEQAKAALMEKQTEIKNYPVASRLINCENDFNRYVNSVFNIIASTVTGRDPHEGHDDDCCGGSCGSCGGCH